MIKTKLLVRRSNKYIYAQLLETETGKTLNTVRGRDPEETGTKIAQNAVKFKIKEIVFDRGRNKYHGQVKKLADSARKGGLKF